MKKLILLLRILLDRPASVPIAWRLMRAGLLSLALPAFAQVSIDAGTAGDNCSGSIWKAGVAGFEDLGPAPFDTERYGVTFSCVVSGLPAGFVVVDIDLIEPNKTAAGQRVFTITANGQVSEPVDVFARVGRKVPYRTSIYTAVNAGTLRLDFRASIGNALVAAFSVRPLALSDLVSGPIDGSSVKLRNQGTPAFVDVYAASHGAWWPDGSFLINLWGRWNPIAANEFSPAQMPMMKPSGVALAVVKNGELLGPAAYTITQQGDDGTPLRISIPGAGPADVVNVAIRYQWLAP